MQVSHQTRGRSGSLRSPVPEVERLERAMVAGLLLEVIIEEPALAVDPQIRRRHIKGKLTHSLMAHLAGRVTLDRFRTLMQRLEQWFPFYYPLMPPLEPPAAEQPPVPASVRPGVAGRSRPMVRHHLLKEWLLEEGGKILPRRPQRKIHPDKLEALLHGTQGRWFRVKEFAQSFDIDRKTAWEYLQKLQDAGLLAHNGGCSAAVRYRLADRFLLVQVTALQRLVSQTLAWLSRLQTEQVGDWLAATAGEAFWEEQLPAHIGSGRRPEIIAALKTAAVLEVVCQSGCQRLLRLKPRWLQPDVPD